VVLTIVALLLAIVTPTAPRQRADAQLTADAHDIAAALRMTRSRAIVTNQSAVFLIDVDRRLYRPAGGSARNVPQDIRVSLYTSQDEAQSAAAGTIRFFPDGSSTGGGIGLAGRGGWDMTSLSIG